MGWKFQAIAMPKAMLFLGFLLFDELFFLARYDQIDQSIQSHALQHIIFGELNRDHPFTYEEALNHEHNMHKKFKEVNSFLLSFVYGFLF
jgi:hypothetical protein